MATSYTAMELAQLRDLVARARLEREEDSLADVTPLVRISCPTGGGAIRYATDAERIEARKRSWRESKRRVFGVCPSCGGEKAAHRSVKVCRSCYLAAVEPAHGTISRYASATHKCRCDQCRAAASTYHRNRRASMRSWKTAA